MEETEMAGERRFVLTFKEVLLLLQSAGVKSINGIDIEEEPVPDEEVILLLDGLVKNGILTAQGDAFVPEEAVGRMIRCMGFPDRDYPSKDTYGDIYCYERGNEILVTRLSRVRPRALELELKEKGGTLL